MIVVVILVVNACLPKVEAQGSRSILPDQTFGHELYNPQTRHRLPIGQVFQRACPHHQPEGDQRRPPSAQTVGCHSASVVGTQWRSEAVVSGGGQSRWQRRWLPLWVPPLSEHQHRRSATADGSKHPLAASSSTRQSTRQRPVGVASATSSPETHGAPRARETRDGCWALAGGSPGRPQA